MFHFEGRTQEKCFHWPVQNGKQLSRLCLDHSWARNEIVIRKRKLCKLAKETKQRKEKQLKYGVSGCKSQRKRRSIIRARSPRPFLDFFVFGGKLRTPSQGSQYSYKKAQQTQILTFPDGGNCSLPAIYGPDCRVPPSTENPAYIPMLYSDLLKEPNRAQRGGEAVLKITRMAVYEISTDITEWFYSLDEELNPCLRFVFTTQWTFASIVEFLEKSWIFLNFFSMALKNSI